MEFFKHVTNGLYLNGDEREMPVGLKKYLYALSLTLGFLIGALVVLEDYGTSWDEAVHFRRGQAYLYYLTG